MEHFTSEESTDFARHTLAPDRRRTMERHLEQGCKDCASELGLWRQVAGIVARESAYQPPEEAVRFVRGYYALHKPPRAMPGTVKVARLLFDTFSRPALAGIRAPGHSTRQALYKAGNVFVDVRLEPQPGADRFSLLGQVLRHVEPRRGANDVPVVVLSGKDTVAHTVTNRLGEFHLELDASRSYRLSVVICRDLAVVIPLPSLPGSGAGRSR